MAKTNRRDFIKISGLLTAGIALTSPQAALAKGTKDKPNVMFICIDDLNDWVGCLGGYPGKVHTPNIDKLAKKGMLFTRAYCSSPMCNPSRVSLWTGKRASTTGAYGQYVQWDDNRVKSTTMFQNFRDQGYNVMGGGKVYHHGTEVHTDPAFHEYLPYARSPKPAVVKKAGPMLYAVCDYDDEEMADHQMVSWCVERIKKPSSKPFFITAGIFRPHSPHWVPKKYFDPYPLEKVIEPAVPEGEMDDIPPRGIQMAAAEKRYYPVLKSGKGKEVVQSYLACVSFCDYQVGRLLDALEKGPHRDNTIVVLWSDHGYHLGEKMHWAKGVLWEESCRIPFIIYDPRTMKKGDTCERPMDSVDIYPTLMDICNLESPKDLDGVSFKKLLSNPTMPWKPAVMMMQRHNATVRSENYRYILYEDGGEELYDHSKDQGEHQNLAGNKELRPVIENLKKYIPKQWARNGLPYPYHKGYIPPLVRKEFKQTVEARKKNWKKPERYGKNPGR